MRLLVAVAVVAVIVVLLVLWLARADPGPVSRKEAEELASLALARYSAAERLDPARFSGPTVVEGDAVCVWMFRYEWTGTPQHRVIVCIDRSGNVDLSLQKEPPSGT